MSRSQRSNLAPFLPHLNVCAAHVRPHLTHPSPFTSVPAFNSLTHSTALSFISSNRSNPKSHYFPNRLFTSPFIYDLFLSNSIIFRPSFYSICLYAYCMYIRTWSRFPTCSLFYLVCPPFPLVSNQPYTNFLILKHATTSTCSLAGRTIKLCLRTKRLSKHMYKPTNSAI